MSKQEAEPIGLRAEVAAGIQRTLLAEARRNESAMADVRAAILVAFAFVELWLLSGPSKLGAMLWPAVTVTFGALAAAVGLAAWLRRGGFSPALAWILPAVDAGVAGLRLSFVFALGAAHVAQTQELATVTGVACLLALSGAFRLQPAAAMWSTAVGLALYVVFAVWLGLPLFFAVVHFVAIAGCGAAGWRLTALVARAVHHEVTRLTLRRLLPAEVVDAADADPVALLTEPRSHDATVVVTDLRGFTTWAEHRSPLDVMSRLNELQGMLAGAVLDEGGTVDKFMGDGMLAVFGAPQAAADHADRALRSVSRMRDGMGRFPEFALAVGVHSGEVVVGCLGTGIRMEFTILGDTVNTASRLESATRELGVDVLVSEACRSRAQRALSPLGSIPLRGRTEPVTVFSLP